MCEYSDIFQWKCKSTGTSIPGEPYYSLSSRIPRLDMAFCPPGKPMPRVAMLRALPYMRAAFRREQPDMVVLDVMLPGADGLQVCEGIRNVSADTPILFLTVKDSTHDKVAGFEAGADDYLPKPINQTLFRARIKSGLEKKHWLDEEKRQKKRER